MEEFKLSDNTDSNKVFIVNRSELERLDPEMALYRKKIFNFNFETQSLGKVLFKKPQYGANEPGIERLTDEQPRYIRITDIDENGLLINNLGVTANTIESKYFLKNNDILIARSGNTVGKTYLHKSKNVKYECFFAGYMIRFVVDESIIFPEFVFTYTQLNIYKEWTKAIQRTAGQPNINAEEYKSLPIPIPPLDIQSNIVAIINNAYSQKQQKETEAKALLDSIDDYLLGELGITLPNEDDEESNLLLAAEPKSSYGNADGFELDKENLLVKKGRLFLTGFSELEGQRWDVFEVINRSEKIEGGKYPNKKLKQIANLVKGQSITSDKIISGEYPVIAGGQTSPYNHNQFNFEGDIITISASGAYSGYVWYHDYPIFASDCTVIYAKNKNEISTVFLSEILKLKQQEIYNLQQGAGQPHVYARDLATLNIPVPSTSKQAEIIQHISSVRAKSEQLYKEAKTVLESTKNEMESMILGN